MSQNDELSSQIQSNVAAAEEVKRLNCVVGVLRARVRRFEAEREIQNDMIDKLIEALKS